LRVIWDVVIVGAGSAGIPAAIEAADAGARLEKYSERRSSWVTASSAE